MKQPSPMHQLIAQLKAADQDHEFYPTTNEIIAALCRDLGTRDDFTVSNICEVVLWVIKNAEREGDCCQVCGVENAKEKCKDCGRLWSPSLIESSVCIFCIVKGKNRIIDRLIEERNALEDLNIAYQKRFGAL